MKISLTFFLFLSLLTIKDSFALCSLKDDHPILSLSGPITHILKELNLLKKVKAISLFHGISKNDFTGDRLGGGIFLSTDYIKKFSKPVLFFDESLEMRKNFKDLNLMAHEVKTRNMDPFEAYEHSLKILLPYLKHCENEITSINKWVNEIKIRFEKKSALKKTYLFYLGGIPKVGRKPNLIMVDNFVLYFKKRKLMATYPTELNYASWSEKVLAELKKGPYLEVGLINGGSEQLEFQSISDGEKNIIQQSLLIPGLAQIKVIEPLWNLLEKQDS
ncbi:MAG: hypothetical protein ACOYL6_10135 [Bacteriovoracaceae bacterium]